MLPALQIGSFEPLQSADLKILSMKYLLLVTLASFKRVGDLQAFSVDESYLEFGPSDGHLVLRPRAQDSYHCLQGPGSEPGSEPCMAAPGGGRPSPGFALSSSRLAIVHRQNPKPQDLRSALCLLRRPAEGKGCLQAEDGSQTWRSLYFVFTSLLRCILEYRI